MKNKTIIISILLSILGLVSFVSASILEKQDGNFNVSVNLRQGWSIIAATALEQGILPDSEIKLSDIKAVWYYSPVLKKYYQLYPNNQLDKVSAEEGRQLDEDIILTSAVWIYSAKAGVLKYDTLEDYPLLSDRKLSLGYNFVTITPDMKGESLNEIKGNCNIERVYHFESIVQKWSQNLVNDNFMNEKLTDDSVGLGLVIKVSSNCTLALEEKVSVPPQIPN